MTLDRAAGSPWSCSACDLMIVLDGTIVNVALPSIGRTSASRRHRWRGSSTPTC